MMRAYVLHPALTRTPQARSPENALDEALALARALPEIEVAGGEVVTVSAPRPGYLFGKGRTDALQAQLRDADVDLVIVDGQVTPVQQRNLEKIWKVKLLDRTGLILEIFAARAATREGVLQVELAALSYQRTRLVRSWTHLERQRGGLGFVGGPGETQIEADRRALSDAITRIRRQLGKVVKTRSLHRAARAKVPFPVVALVGYTNAGKSTLFNRMTGAEVMAKDMLFATLDPTMRAIRLDGGREVILSDTVGFISDLPTQLVAAFRATLEEVLAADLVLHVRDIAHPETEAQAADVALNLDALGLDPAQTPVIEVWNKADLLDDATAATARNIAERRDDVVLVSALTGQGVDALSRAIADALAPDLHTARVRLTFEQGRERAWLYGRGVVTKERQTARGLTFDVRWSARQAAEFEALRRPAGRN